MGQPFVGEIKMFAGDFAPQGWAICQGQLLAIEDYDTLFDLIGTTYGGDGTEILLRGVLSWERFASFARAHEIAE